MEVKKHYRQHTTPNYEMGHYYLDHVMAMTQEDLHHKGEIAEELAVRDMTIESLRQQLDECQKACLDYDRKWHDAQYKLDECQKGRDYWEHNANEMNAHWKKEISAVTRERDNYKQMIKEQWACPELATVTAERDELVAALEIAEVGMCAVGVPHAGERKVLQDAVNVVRAALAKLGADKTATYEEIKAEFLTRAHGGID